MKNRYIALGLCLLIISFTFTAGCIRNNTKKNLPPIIHINVKYEVYSNTTFYFNVFVEDPDGNITNLRAQWDFNSDGQFDWDSKSDDCELYINNGHFRQSHSYGLPGKYSTVLKVTDEGGKTSTEECNITVIPDSLSIDANLDKNAYLILTVTIQNNGPKPINVSEMGFYYSTLGETKITTPEGYIIQTYLRVSCMPSEVTIDNNNRYTDISDLLKLGWGIWDGEEWTEYNLTTRGKYSIEVIYDSYPNGEVWNGEMRTEPITFLII